MLEKKRSEKKCKNSCLREKSLVPDYKRLARASVKKINPI